MPLDLLSLPADDAERIAYDEGFTMAAEAFANWEQRNGPVDLYKDFFEECFTRLAGHYPAPSITSDYDKSVIFEAIEKGAAE